MPARLEARVSPEERARLEWAARVAGTSVSTFVIDAAVDRAEGLIAAEMSTTVPAVYFDRLLGYFAIVPHLIARAEAPTKLARGAPREIPAILLAKLALAEGLHGQGLGGSLLVLALGVVIEAARLAGGKVVVVDAIDESAAAFYEHHDFQRLPDRPDRLIMKLSTVARALEVGWP